MKLVILDYKDWIEFLKQNSLFPLQSGKEKAIRHQIFEQAQSNPKFFQDAIALKTIRFLVDESHLQGIQYLDGDVDVSILKFFNN